MAFPRAAVMRSCFRDMRHTPVGPRFLRSVARRGYASIGRTPNYGGDALWAAGAIAVTIPSCWYLLSNRPHQSHNSQDHDESQELSNNDEENSEEDLKKTSDIYHDARIEEGKEDESTDLESKQATDDDENSNDTSSQTTASEIEAGDNEKEATVSKPIDDSESYRESQRDS